MMPGVRNIRTVSQTHAFGKSSETGIIGRNFFRPRNYDWDVQLTYMVMPEIGIDGV